MTRAATSTDQASDERDLLDAFDKMAVALIPLNRDLREQAFRMLASFLGLSDAAPAAKNAEARRGAGHRAPPPFRIASREPPSSMTFLRYKKPVGNVERVVCLAGYLVQHRGVKRFKVADVVDLDHKSGGKTLEDASATIDDAIRDGFVAYASKTTMRLLPEGEQFVHDLPDRDTGWAKFDKAKANRQRRNAARTHG